MDSPVSTVGTHEVFFSKTTFDFLSTPFSISAIKQFEKLAQNADIIHYHFPWPFMDLVDFISNVDRPKIVSYHSDIIRQKNLLRLYRPLMHNFLSKVDRIIATSPNYFESSDVLQQYQKKVDIIPIGVDPNTYPSIPADVADGWRQKLGERYFLFIGKLRYYKGLHFLIEAAKNAPYPIVIAGSGPEEEQLKKQAIANRATNIYFLGELSEVDKMAVLRGCYSLVFPSHLRSEAFGISLLEAAMEAKPLISCEIGTGTTYINKDKSTGIVIPPEDPQAIRNAMDTLWYSPELAQTYGKNALLRFEEVFTADKMAERYASVYQELVKMA